MGTYRNWSRRLLLLVCAGGLFCGLEVKALAQAQPNWGPYYAAPSSQPLVPGRTNNAILQVVNKRMDAVGIPANDNRRPATVTALRTAATNAARARGVLAQTGRLISFGGLLIATYSAVGALLDANEIAAIEANDDPASAIKPTPIDFRRNEFNEVIATLMKWPGRAYSELNPSTGTGITERRASMSGRWPSTMPNVLVCSTTKACLHAFMGDQYIAPQDNPPAPREGFLPKHGLKRVEDCSAGGFQCMRLTVERVSYRQVNGTRVPANSYTIQSSLSLSAPTWTVGNGAQTCGGGVWVYGACNQTWTSVNIDQPVVVQAEEVASLLPARWQTAKVSNASLATVIDGLLKDAANLAGYQGVPYSPLQPVTAEEVAAALADRPDLRPTLADFFSPVSTAAVAGQTIAEVPFPYNATATQGQPGFVPDPATQQNPQTGGNTVVNQTVDLGPNPGTAAPTLEAPTGAEIIAPLFTWFDLDVTVPTTQTCPVNSVRIEFMETDITTQPICDAMEQFRAMISATALLIFTIGAAMIVLRA